MSQSGQKLSFLSDNPSLDEVANGSLISEDAKHRYPIKNVIPRFVNESNYADNFGMQWNHFSKPA